MKPANMLTVKEAIELIDSDTPQNPVVNNVELIKRSEYLLTNYRGNGMNYTIFLVKRDEKTGKIVPNGKKWAVINSPREQQDLVNAITDHYKARSGKDVDPEKLGLRKQTTVVERDVAGAGEGLARVNASSKLEYGSALESDSRSRTVEGY